MHTHTQNQKTIYTYFVQFLFITIVNKQLELYNYTNQSKFILLNIVIQFKTHIDTIHTHK